jgi:hypothetical protein
MRIFATGILRPHAGKVLFTSGVNMSDDIYDQTSLFQGLTANQRGLLKSLFVPVDFYQDACIFAQGDPADYLYVLIVPFLVKELWYL